MRGIYSVTVGYAGGIGLKPTYQTIKDHTEAVRIEFDPSSISYEDILEEMKFVSATAIRVSLQNEPSVAAEEPGFSPAEAHLLQALGFDPTGLDALQARTGLDTPALQAQLMALELQGHLVRLPGGLFQRMARA